MWYLRTPSFWLEAANRGWRMLFLWRVESFTERCVVWGCSHKVLNELLHRQRLLLQWRCCFIPCTLQFNPVCSSKKKNVLIVLEVRSPSLCFTAWSAGTGGGGDTNAALPGMSRSHIQLALVHCLAAPGHWVGGWQQRQARWVHPPVTSQRPTVRFLSQSACFHSDVQRLSRREALRRWGNPGWEESPEETRGKKVLKDSNFCAIFVQFLSLKGPVCIFFLKEALRKVFRVRV